MDFARTPPTTVIPAPSYVIPAPPYVIPAKAGIHGSYIEYSQLPAQSDAGVLLAEQLSHDNSVDPGLRRDDGV